MEIRHLRYFITVAEELNFSRAAEKLCIAQPPLSQQIRALEQELDVQLFDRQKRPIQLTPAGQVFLDEAYRILSQLEQAVRTTKRIGSGEKGRLSIGFTSSIANSVLPDILRNFCGRFPEIELVWRELSTFEQIQSLRDRQIDVGFFHLTHAIAEYDDLDFRIIIEEPLIIVLPEKHSLATHSKIDLKDLKNEVFVLPSRQFASGLSEQVYDLFYQANITPNVIQEATFMLTVLGLVAGGIGVSLLPANAQNLQRKGVVYKEIAEPVSVVKMAVFWRRSQLSPVLSNFLEITQIITNHHS
jgi:DNA-binding transcriptional LysR family regulator